MDPYLGEIRIFAGQAAPKDWHFCDGSLLSITAYQALYTLMGTVYGGDGRTTFAIPDLRGRVTINAGQGTGLSLYNLGATGGADNVGLDASNLPAHTHDFLAVSGSATSLTPTPANGMLLGAKNDTGNPTYPVSSFLPAGLPGQTEIDLNDQIISTEGGNGSHENRMPYTSINYIICLMGIFPTPS